jgi:hypothetical protein
MILLSVVGMPVQFKIFALARGTSNPEKIQIMEMKFFFVNLVKFLGTALLVIHYPYIIYYRSCSDLESQRDRGVHSKFPSAIPS